MIIIPISDFLRTPRATDLHQLLLKPRRVEARAHGASISGAKTVLRGLQQLRGPLLHDDDNQNGSNIRLWGSLPHRFLRGISCSALSILLIMMRWPFMNPSACQSLVLLISFFLLINVEKAECLGYVSNSSLGSRAYEWGFLGGYPRQSFKSSSLRPPRMNLVQWDEQCGQGYTLLTLRGTSVSKPTAVIMDGTGELVWMDESFGYIMNLKIQRYKGQQYLTFWSGAFGEGFGKGTYYMVCTKTL